MTPIALPGGSYRFDAPIALSSLDRDLVMAAADRAADDKLRFDADVGAHVLHGQPLAKDSAARSAQKVSEPTSDQTRSLVEQKDGSVGHGIDHAQTLLPSGLGSSRHPNSGSRQRHGHVVGIDSVDSKIGVPVDGAIAGVDPMHSPVKLANKVQPDFGHARVGRKYKSVLDFQGEGAEIRHVSIDLWRDRSGN